MKALFLKVEHWTTTAATLAACAMLVLAASMGFYQVVARFILEQTTEWTEVVIRFSLIWMVFLALSKAYRIGAMISVDVLRRWAPPRLRRGLETTVALVCAALSLVLVFYGWDYAVRGRFQTVAGLESVSMFWAYLALPVGGACSLFGILGQWLEPVNRELETSQ